MSDTDFAIKDIRLVALDGERSYEDLPATREVAIRVKVNVMDAAEDDEVREGWRPTVVLTTLVLDVFGVDDDESINSSPEVGPVDEDELHERSPIYSGRVTFRIDAERSADDDPQWVPAIFAKAWPYLRSQTITHAQLLGMGRIPVPIFAPENLAREPSADDN